MTTKNYITTDKDVESKCLNGRLAARYLGVSYAKFRTLQGIPYFKIGNNTKRYPKDGLDKWIQENTIKK